MIFLGFLSRIFGFLFVLGSAGYFWASLDFLWGSSWIPLGFLLGSFWVPLGFLFFLNVLLGSFDIVLDFFWISSGFLWGPFIFLLEFF